MAVSGHTTLTESLEQKPQHQMRFRVNTFDTRLFLEEYLIDHQSRVMNHEAKSGK